MTEEFPELIMFTQHVTNPPEAQKNFLVVDAKTETQTIEHAFENFTHKRKDIAILLINQHVCHKIARNVCRRLTPQDCREDPGTSRYLHGSVPGGTGNSQ